MLCYFNILQIIFFTSGSASSTSDSSTDWTGAGVSTIVGVGAAGVSTGGGLLGNGGGISVTFVV